MSADNTGTGSRRLRLIGGSVVTLAGLALLAFLLVAGVVVWLFGVALPRHQDTVDDQSLAAARSFADHGQQKLASAVADGKLTDAEVTAVVGTMWTIERSADRWAVTTRYPAGSKDVCFRFDIALPLGPGARVTHTELPDCPLIGPHPGAS
ncbi:hypothetical protein AB0368_30945 [Actinoplanes sp. NPDC051475]|uniref:hypothetical protein n=1 Tax=Actinoplanes sp. NPDC051475 TaxID=3157225 RepID=UPI00344E483E